MGGEEREQKLAPGGGAEARGLGPLRCSYTQVSIAAR